MKISRVEETKFNPVSIILETKRELELFRIASARVGSTVSPVFIPICMNTQKELEDLFETVYKKLMEIGNELS